MRLNEFDYQTFALHFSVSSSSLILANFKSSDTRKVTGLTIDNEYQWFEVRAEDQPTTGQRNNHLQAQPLNKPSLLLFEDRRQDKVFNNFTIIFCKAKRKQFSLNC